MQFSKNTSRLNNKGLLIKVFLILIITIGVTTLLNKIKFPSPNKNIEKIIPNEKLKIVK
jgi:hypothetical protein|tara:strand:- start:215 stop:391 length:177 start_codon:yes stop_codon:yes gene_type:complete